MDSIMMQKTDFMVEVVVGDDFSTDGTLDIIKSYNNTNNIHIKILERKVNDEYWEKRQKFNRLYNFINIIENCSGKYIALLEGDDYWTDPHKLQKQVNYLEANPHYAGCSHQVMVIYQNSLKKGHFFRENVKETFILDDLLDSRKFHTASLVFRKEI